MVVFFWGFWEPPTTYWNPRKRFNPRGGGKDEEKKKGGIEG